jgi:archaeoflavoprotein AfpA
MKMVKVKVAWGITGSGDKIIETIEAMLRIKQTYQTLDIEVFPSKAGQQVAKYYKVYDKLRDNFTRVYVEENANTPFLVGRFLIVAPATSNTVAKIVHGIADTLLTSGVIQALKADVPVYIMPCDFKEGRTTTTLPDGRKLRLRIRKEDAANVGILKTIEGLTVFEKPDEIENIFKNELRALAKASNPQEGEGRSTPP